MPEFLLREILRVTILLGPLRVKAAAFLPECGGRGRNRKRLSNAIGLGSSEFVNGNRSTQYRIHELLVGTPVNPHECVIVHCAYGPSKVL